MKTTALFLGTILAAKGGAMSEGPKTPEDYGAAIHVLLKMGDFDGAEQSVHEAAKKFPDTTGFHFMMGRVHEGRGHYADAFYEYQWEALKVGVDRELGAASAKFAHALTEKRGTDMDEIRKVVVALQENDAKKAVASLASIDRERPDRMIPRLYLAEAKQRGGDLAGAAAIYRELIERDPYFVAPLINLAEVLEKAGKKAEGAKLREKAKKIDPENWRLK